MPYCDNFWHKDAHENIPSPACLVFFVKLKTENQLIRFEQRLIEARLGIQQSVVDQAIDEFALMHVSKPKESILNKCCSTTVNNFL